jgi:predicted GTPase
VNGRELEPSTPLEYFRACLRQSRSGLGRTTVAVLGRTGAGKSTLINAVFGADVAATGVGGPVTGALAELEVEGAPLVLLDTPGLELGGEAAAQAAGLVADEVARRAALGVADALHVAWYCVDASSDRFEPAEADLVRRCAEHVPTIVVVTKAPDPEDEAVQALRAHVAGLSPAIEAVLPVLARGRALGSRQIEPYCLDALIATTVSVLPEAARRAFVVAQRHAIEQQVIEARAIVAARALSAAQLGVGGGGIDADRLARHQLRMLADISVVFSLTVPEPVLRRLVEAVSAGADSISELARALLVLLEGRGVPGIAVADRLVSAGTAVAATRALGEAYARVCRELATRTLDGRPLPADLLETLRGFLR